MLQGSIKRTFWAAMALCLSVSAGATTIGYDNAMDANGVAKSAVTGVTTVDFNHGCGYARCTGNYAIRTGRVANAYSAPRLDDAGPNETPFLSAPATIFADSTASTYTLGQTANYFGLLWGSIDPFNVISFLDNGRIVARYTGGSLTESSRSSDHPLAIGDSAYVNFFDLPAYDSIRLTSPETAFETDNHAYGTVNTASDVPEPGALGLFAFALVGLGALVRRRAPY
ncbi:PEP-CTERM sorting domain-containing protein [Salinisphaera sp. Q1T1-3]|uniref:PEP-CTERM sorting domain-containing protein n=1 Tax=Salinisphaera sp. Q1T1-3 TaxID=2321229 RepID=UPI000E71B25E|nr:PEP-CTERM sorting domain-containing protein [Salinisphaera sp. Q1T1-3]RJS94832.1 PEP-CTERM sorting domain-containing protein [Salinisphaera sp. Q1T1-3]